MNKLRERCIEHAETAVVCAKCANEMFLTVQHVETRMVKIGSKNRPVLHYRTAVNTGRQFAPMTNKNQGGKLRFAAFEVDLSSGEL